MEQAEIAAAESEKKKDGPEAEVGATTEQIPPEVEGSTDIGQSSSPEVEGSTAIDQSSSPEVEDSSAAEQSSSPQTEEEAAVILQSNYRGYRERKKVKEQCQKKAEKQSSTKQSLEAKKSNQNKVQDAETGTDQNNVASAHVPSISHDRLDQKTPAEDKEILPPAGKSSMKQKPPGEHSEEDKNQAVPQKASIKKASKWSQQTSQEISGTDEKSRAALVTQDSHVERGSLKHSRIIPCENKGSVRKSSMRGSQKHTEASKQSSADKEKAALVIQSNYRGYLKRGQLKKEGKLPCGNQEGKGGGHSQNLGSKVVKERRSSSAHTEGHKNISNDGTEKEKSDLAAFSRQVRNVEV